jgi:hypothetical protein
MIQEAVGYGYGEYRTHLLFQDQVSRTYSWNNSALMGLPQHGQGLPGSEWHPSTGEAGHLAV